MIKKGDKIHIKDNLAFQMQRLEFDESTITEFVKRFSGTEQIVYDIWRDGAETYVTIDMCCEVPIEACEKI